MLKKLFLFFFIFNFSYCYSNKLERSLSYSVSNILNKSINNNSPPTLFFNSKQEKINYEQWLSINSNKLIKKIPSKLIREDFLQTIWYESQRAGLDVSLVLAIIEVESNFRKFAISSSGAIGYMQIMPFWIDLISNNKNTNLFDLRTNIRFGTVILRHYLNIEKGNLFLTLGRYNGSRGSNKYPNLVFLAQKKWL